MEVHILKLHIVQAERSLLKSRNNNYSDKEKQDYQSNLSALLNNIKTIVQDKIEIEEAICFKIKRQLDFIFKSLEFLDSSILNLIPYEIVECLNSALRDWISKRENYIIVTSLVNRTDEFSFDESLISDPEVYSSIKIDYGINFKNKLIQINLPKALSRDYLVSVVHYHELGHFIDVRYSITKDAAFEIYDNWNSSKYKGKNKQAILGYFPFLNEYSPGDPENYGYIDKYIETHLSEYFCDLFACQYIGPHLDNYLLYITENEANYNDNHPSALNRSLVVNNFLNGEDNFIVNSISRIMRSISGLGSTRKLKIRYELPKKEDFLHFLPPVIERASQLHGLIVSGWEIWGGDWAGIVKSMEMEEEPSPSQVYRIINNLIEKSIGNYIITNKWKENTKEL